ncbi:MAG: radical SAM family heme chaperone HemW, partial [Alphaproteobacteria bacterium]|nr:radical SAM family heme chaperone HemW [Alphaproteobacteria bacterium]
TAFSLYVHFPYCRTICPYCDFFVKKWHPDKPATRHTELDWGARYHTEIRRLKQLTAYHTIRSVYLGGGTPSLAPPALWATLLETVAAHWSVDQRSWEVTLEANPEDITLDRLRQWQQGGITRLSLGVQALDERSLKGLGRNHTVEQALQAIRWTQQVFPAVSVDLIVARPDQTPAMAKTELATLLQTGIDHVSVYGLTIEPNTAFAARMRRGQLSLPDEGTAVAIDEVVTTLMAQHGLDRYEVSNYARPMARAIHNTAYWQGKPYGGIGPSAAGRIQVNGQWTATKQHTKHWGLLDDNSAAEDVFTEFAPLSAHEEWQERIMMGLRRLGNAKPCDASASASASAETADEGVTIPHGVREFVMERVIDRHALATLVGHGLLTEMTTEAGLQLVVPVAHALRHDGIVRELMQ